MIDETIEVQTHAHAHNVGIGRSARARDVVDGLPRCVSVLSNIKRPVSGVHTADLWIATPVAGSPGCGYCRGEKRLSPPLISLDPWRSLDYSTPQIVNAEAGRKTPESRVNEE